MSETKPLREIKILLWVKAFGESIEVQEVIPSPLVSNQPCPHIQNQMDRAVAETYAGFHVSHGVDLIP